MVLGECNTLLELPATRARNSSHFSRVDALGKPNRLPRTSERQGRTIDHDQIGSVEKKKQEGRL